MYGLESRLPEPAVESKVQSHDITKKTLILAAYCSRSIIGYI